MPNYRSVPETEIHGLQVLSTCIDKIVSVFYLQFVIEIRLPLKMHYLKFELVLHHVSM